MPYLHSATYPDTAVNAKNMDTGMDERVLNFEDEYFQMTFFEVFVQNQIKSVLCSAKRADKNSLNRRTAKDAVELQAKS